MNILLYCNSFLPAIGGREMVIHYLAQNLYQMGHRVRVSGVSGWWRHRRLSFEYPVHRWPTLRGLIDKTVKTTQLRLECSLWKTDIIHAHNTYPSGYIAAKVCKKNHIPLVITPHGMDIHVIPEIGFGDRLDPRKREMSDYALKVAVLTTAISANIKQSLNKAGVSDHKIRSIPNGIDLERFKKGVTIDIRRHYKLSLDAQIILAVGNYHKRKGLELIIKAMPQILSNRKNIFLLIVGRSDDILKESVENLKLHKNVILTGPIQFPASSLLSAKRSLQQQADQIDLLAAIYLQSNVYVSASMSEGAEGLSLALLDAAAAGLPIVATDISGNRDFVKNDKNGYLVPPNEHESLAQAIIKILSNKQISDGFREKNKIASEKYSWREITTQYLDVYKEVINKING
jgi:glycosyltransferase involved in cell wall biosynthesis